jgi:16S rRNA (guanine1516-N2)-methyltransferase
LKFGLTQVMLINVSLSFISDALIRRIERSPQEKDLLRAALGKAKSSKGLRILDATAGLGRDALRMAYWGHLVVACERSPQISAELIKAHQEAKEHPFFSSWIERLKIIPQSTEDYLNAHKGESFDVVVIDPMFPTEKRSALPKKDIQFLMENLEPSDESDNAQALLNFCWQHPWKSENFKILLKRPLKSASLLAGAKTPHKALHSYKGRAHKWDVYLWTRRN